MDEGGPRENRRHRVDSRMDYYKWNMVPQYQAKEQSAYHMHTKISMLYGERDAALEERDRALSEKAAALEARDLAIQQRDEAITDRDNALRERDNAMAALQFQESTMNALLSSGARGLKRTNPSTQHRSANIQSMLGLEGECITEAFPVSVVAPEVSQSNQVTKTKVKNNVMPKSIKSSRKVKKLGEDLNRHVTTDGSKAEWDAQDFGSLDQIQFDESTMPGPVCSCTGVHRQCYKWGSGGWQSSCCTTSLSVYPLPQMPNKKHARMGGRKMSGSVFSRLLTRLGTAGHDLSIPVDLKNYWAKHGTNRYISYQVTAYTHRIIR